MPRKTGYHHNEMTKTKIKAQQLVNRLEEHALASAPIMDASQVNAAKVLLNKVIPDTKAIELTGPDGGPLSIQWLDK